MLVISRKESESITIELADGLDPSVTLRSLFDEGPIQIRLVHIGSSRVRLAIEAPRLLRITRGPAEETAERTPALLPQTRALAP